MAVILVCILLVLAGLVGVVRWGGLTVQPPPSTADPADPTDQPSVARVVQCYLWYLVVAIASGVVAGILAAGAGGRLVMRLLAVTAGPDAQGRITEADEIVGRISTDGTLGFVIFTGLFVGLVTGPLYLLLLPLGTAGLVVAIVGAGVVLASQLPMVVAGWRDRRSVTVGRVALILVVVVAFPGFASAVVDILGRS
jgi:hypothetical protein